MNSRRVFTSEFKRQVVQEYYATSLNQTKLEEKYGIGKGCVCRWLKEDLVAKENAFPGHGRLPADQAEVATLRRELHEVQEENTILKKTLILMAQEHKSVL
jgi:transposase